MYLTEIDLIMSDDGWRQAEASVPRNEGVYLHFGLVTKDDHSYWVPLRIGQSYNIHSRWFTNAGSHKQAFYAIKHNNQTWKGKNYCLTYPNYAFFFDQLRNHCRQTKLVFVEMESTDNQTRSSVEQNLIKSLHPVWEQTYKKREPYGWVTHIDHACNEWLLRYRHQRINMTEDLKTLVESLLI